MKWITEFIRFILNRIDSLDRHFHFVDFVIDIRYQRTDFTDIPVRLRLTAPIRAQLWSGGHVFFSCSF
ncbi:MAG: hypothetical protein LV471_12075 [Nitrosomonas sp.]|nr:hypothetical protein [Nitrosomonas sp.]